MAVKYVGGAVVSNAELRSKLEQLSQQLGRDITVHGGDRDAQKNATVHGSSASQHLSGNAADISIAGMSLKDAAEAAAAAGLFNGIGYYENSKAVPGGFGAHVHVDVRTAGGTARWAVDKDKKKHSWTSSTTIGPMGVTPPPVAPPATPPPAAPPSPPSVPEPPDHEPHDFHDHHDHDHAGEADPPTSESEMETDPGEPEAPETPEAPGAPEPGPGDIPSDHPDVPIGGELGAGAQDGPEIDLDPAPDDPSDLESDPNEDLDLDPAPDDPSDLESDFDSDLDDPDDSSDADADPEDS